MPIEVKKREGESPSALLFRFSKRVKRSGVLKEARRRRFKTRSVNRNKRRISAIHKAQKRKDLDRAKKLGLD